jgi:uncharacterized protein (TIGR03437 family)
VVLVAGDVAIAPQWARAAPGMLGLAAIQFQVPQEPPTPLQLRAIVNAGESNTVTLPVE